MPFLDYLNDPAVLLSRNGHIVEANDAFLSVCNSTKTSIIGEDCRKVEPFSLIWSLITASLLHRTNQSERILFGASILDVSIKPIIEGDLTQYVLVFLRDVTSFVSLEEDLRKRNQELIVMNTLSTAFIGSNNIETVYNDLLEKVLLVSNMDMGWIAVLDDDLLYSVKSISGFPDSFKTILESERFKPIYENAARSEKPIHILEAADIKKVDFLANEGVVLIALIPLRVEGGRTIGFMGLASRMETAFDYDLATLFSSIGNHLSLIAEKIVLFHETQRLSITDGLTGLFNSRHFYQCLDREISRAERYKENFSLVLLDVDNFKAFNDRYGHQSGDRILVEISSHMRKVSRSTDILARYGGEEFMMLLPCTKKDDAFIQASRLMTSVENHDFLVSSKMQVSISGGVASFPEDAQDAKALLYASDMAMYEAKEKGKKRICMYKPK